jgi:hypothetical protein
MIVDLVLHSSKVHVVGYLIFSVFAGQGLITSKGMKGSLANAGSSAKVNVYAIFSMEELSILL